MEEFVRACRVRAGEGPTTGLRPLWRARNKEAWKTRVSAAGYTGHIALDKKKRAAGEDFAEMVRQSSKRYPVSTIIHIYYQLLDE